MRKLVPASIAACCLAGGASAACLPEGPTAQAFTVQTAPDQSARIAVVAATLVQMDPFAPKALKGVKTTCEVATFSNGKTAYALSGTADKVMPRVAASKERGAPLWFLMAVPDLVAQMAKPPPSSPPPPLGYALMSRDDKFAVLYRAYDIVPADRQLALDMGAALEGRVPPILRADLATHKVDITTASDAGTVKAPAPAP